jgi:hypothetical protein
MKVLLTCLILGFAVSAFSQGADIMARERAKGLANQNNARHGVAPPSQSATPSAAPAPAPPPASLPQLRTDLANIKAGATVTADQKQKVAADIANGAQTKPPQAAANKLADDLAAAFSSRPLSSANLARFVQQVDALINPSKFPSAKPDGIYGAIRAAFVDAGVEQKLAGAIVEDLKALK